MGSPRACRFCRKNGPPRYVQVKGEPEPGACVGAGAESAAHHAALVHLAYIAFQKEAQVHIAFQKEAQVHRLAFLAHAFFCKQCVCYAAPVERIAALDNERVSGMCDEGFKLAKAAERSETAGQGDT